MPTMGKLGILSFSTIGRIKILKKFCMTVIPILELEKLWNCILITIYSVLYYDVYSLFVIYNPLIFLLNWIYICIYI